MTLGELATGQAIMLRGSGHQVDLPIAVRNDELVTNARLRLHYRHAPDLLPELSALSVLVNDEVVGRANLDARSVDGAEFRLDIDPRTLVGYSRLGLRANLSQSAPCETPGDIAPWVLVAQDSLLELEVQQLPAANQLSALPEPFFDARDRRPLRLPIVLPDGPNADELAAAGMVASWFGALAESRGWDFTAELGHLPQTGHAVMIAMRPRLVGVSLGHASGAQVAVVDHPSDALGKVLVVTGDDALSLRAAARALSLGRVRIEGASAIVSDLDAPPARRAYDAPRWVPTDRPVTFGERIEPEKLRVAGAYPPAIRIPWHLPPDLFYWRSKGAVVDLAFRYTPTAGARSTLDLAINGEFADAVPLPPDESLRAAAAGAGTPSVGSPVGQRQRLYVPISTFGADNTLGWQFNFDRGAAPACAAASETPLEGAVEATSTIDLSALPHYTELPDLKLFIDGAFPFSTYADLSHTVAVLPTYPAAAEVAAFLNVLGHVGATTGYPGTLLRVTDAATAAAIRPDADLLVFGTPQSQPLVAEWADRLPITFQRGRAALRAAGVADRLRARFSGRDLDGARGHAARMIAQGGAGVAALLSFESPLARDRVVLMFTALEPSRLPALVAALGDPARRDYAGGDLTLLSGEQLSAYEFAPRYTLGRLPFFMGLRWWLSSQPLVLALMALLLSAGGALLAFASLRRVAQARLRGP